MRKSMKWFKSKSTIFLNLLVIFISSAFSFGAAEALTRVYSAGEPDSKYIQRVMLFEMGNNLQNVGRIFKYFPNSAIRSKTLYLNHELTGAVHEYDYTIITNNLGLVQKRDIEFGQKIHLIIGDSFAEGQGATPWFYELESNWRDTNVRPVNAGILGSGPSHWVLMVKHLQDEYGLDIQKIDILLILPDLKRYVWNFRDPVIDCLRTARCSYSRGFQGFDFSNKRPEQIEREVLRASNELPIVPGGLVVGPNRNLEPKNLVEFTKELLKKSAFVRAVHAQLKSFLDEEGTLAKEEALAKEEKIVNQNLEAISRLVKLSKHGGEIIVINTKDEVAWAQSGTLLDRHNSLGMRFSNWAQEFGVDYKVCVLGKSDFHINDPHPNEKGYAKIRKCVIH
jgi:hypothetical protein